MHSDNAKRIHMLLNISNHPSSQWPEEQLGEAIRQFSGVEDLPHPDVDPAASTEAVVNQAKECLEGVKALNPAAVHVMGEHTFCHALIPMLQQAGYPVFCSTTSRKIEHISDTQIRRTFSFVRFREYALIDLIENI